MDLPDGMRKMHTFKKLPMISPNRKTKIPMKVDNATHQFCPNARRPSSQRFGIVPDC
jgi:hypothetical protein